MPERPFRIVVDTNTLLRGLVSATSAAAKVRRAAEQRLFIPLLSKPVLDEYRRDPRDEKFLELAISLKATHIVSSDRDLLSLSQERNEAGKRFRQRLPGALVIEAGAFIHRHGADLKIV